MRIVRAVAVCATVCLHPDPARAQTRTLTFADVLTRAREQAPQIVSARLALEEARARLAGAALRFQRNPEIDAEIGSRRATEQRSPELAIGVSQQFEPGSRRAARIAGVQANIAHDAATVEETTRTVLRMAAVAYHRALHASERVRLLNLGDELASQTQTVAERRFSAGDIATLDVNIARASRARVRADREAAEADRALALGELKQLLHLDADIAVSGELARRTEADLTTLLAAASERPELRALQAAVNEAEAEIRLAHTFTRPDYGVGVKYSREAGDTIVLGGVTIALPIFSNGQEGRAVGAARATRLRAELDAARRRVQLEVRAAFEGYTRRVAAVRVLEADAIGGLDENDRLTTRSFEVGQLGLPELLLLRREILETRAQYLDALLEAAVARIDLDSTAAVLR
jgi:outer membrane protein, heavy metal efflux system